jgi:hypothetical protein
VRDQHYAIIVGICAYPGISSLEGPCNDAQDFHDWLLREDGGAVPPDNVKMLLTTDFEAPQAVEDARPDEADLNALFRRYVHDGALHPWIGERLYIFLAGHGFADPQDANSAALYAANAALLFPLHVAATAFAEWFRRNAAFKEIVLIMDCCRTATQLQAIAPPMLPQTRRTDLASQVRTFYAYATGWGGVAREKRIAGNVRGIFTTSLLNALQEAVPNRRGRVTGSVVHDYIHQNIAAVAGDVTVRPPEIYPARHGEITFVERAAPAAEAVRIRLDPFAGGEVVVLLDGPGNEIARATATEREVAFPLTPGFYKVLVEGTPREQLFEVVGERVNVTL